MSCGICKNFKNSQHISTDHIMVISIYAINIKYMKERKIDQIFAENVVYFRKKQGYSQSDLAVTSGISRTMISHYEREGRMPPAARLQTLANSLKIPVFKLFMERQAGQDTHSDLQDIDPRSVKKLKDILSLPPEDRNDLYRILNKMLRKNQLEKQLS